jgi:predicted transcriptional regulator
LNFWGITTLNLGEIKEILQAEILTKNGNLNMTVSSVMASDLMSDVLSFCHSGTLLITSLSNSQAVRTADIADLSAIIFVRGKRPSEETIQLAEERTIPLLRTRFSMFKVCCDLYSNGLIPTIE